MSPHAYTEDPLVEQPATGLFDAPRWQTVPVQDETLGVVGARGCHTRSEMG